MAQGELFKVRKLRFRLTAPKPAVSENDLEGRILVYMRRRGWRAQRLHVGKFRAGGGHWVQMEPEGTADWLFTRPPRDGAPFGVLFIEVKRPGEEPTERQLSFLRERRAEGYPATWVDSIEKLDAWYRRLIWGRVRSGAGMVAKPAARSNAIGVPSQRMDADLPDHDRALDNHRK